MWHQKGGQVRLVNVSETDDTSLQGTLGTHTLKGTTGHDLTALGGLFLLTSQNRQRLVGSLQLRQLFVN